MMGNSNFNFYFDSFKTRFFGSLFTPMKIKSWSSTPWAFNSLTGSHLINSSVLENGDLITIFNNNPYLKLEGILFFTLSIMLYGLIALTIINIISKYGTNLNNYFKNKYILMYINLNKKYLNILTWVWTGVLFFSIILCLIISYVLIDCYDMYCIQSPNVINSLLLFSLSSKNNNLA